MHGLLVVVGQQVGDLVHGLAWYDDAELLYGFHRPLHNGQTVAVQRNNGQLIRRDLK